MKYNIELTKKEIKELQEGIYALISDYDCKEKETKKHLELIRKLENVLKQKYKKIRDK